MLSKTPTGKNSKGTPVVEVEKDRLRIRFRVNGQRKTLYLGLSDTKENRIKADEVARKIAIDLLNPENFDPALNKYRIHRHIKIVEDKPKIPLRCIELWSQYTEAKKDGLKAKTLEKYENFGRLYSKLKSNVLDVQSIQKELKQITKSTDRRRDALMYLSSACKWAIKHGILESNPYEGLYKDLPKPNYMMNPKPNAFTLEERNEIIEKFATDQRKGMNYRRYTPIVKFLFYSGCRPSEAIGLRWENISDDCSRVTFCESIVQVRNRRVRSEGSKNNKTRIVTIAKKAQEMLLELKRYDSNLSGLVFTNINDEPLNYRNFSRRGWKAIVDPIKPETTPYNCRDTFITQQLLAGTPTAIIAEWCDTSIEMIEQNYADQLKLLSIRPADV
jgi:integrase